jgi:hypothetical protein
MCYHIVAACSICEARINGYAFIKPCSDRAQVFGSAALTPIATLRRFFDTGELSPCPNDQVAFLRSSFAPAPPCAQPNCVSALAPVLVYEWTTEIPQFLSDATQRLFGHQNPNYSNPWTQQDRVLLLNAALVIDMRFALASFVAHTGGGDDGGLHVVQVGAIALNAGSALGAEQVPALDQGFVDGAEQVPAMDPGFLDGHVTNPSIADDLGNLLPSPAANQAIGENQLHHAGQPDPSPAPKRKRNAIPWTDEADEMLMQLHAQTDANGRRLWPYPKMIVSPSRNPSLRAPFAVFPTSRSLTRRLFTL